MKVFQDIKNKIESDVLLKWTFVCYSGS